MRRPIFPTLPLVLAVLALALAGCSKPKTVLTTQQKNEVDKSILAALPEDPGLVRLDADFGGKIKLLGYTLSGGNLMPGKTSTLTWYWQSTAALDGDYKIFVHLDGARRLTLDHYAVAGLLPVSAWKPGQIIQDSQLIEVPASYPPGGARLWVGLFDAAAWKQQHKDVRLPVKDPGKTTKDAKERLLVAKLWVGEKNEKKANAWKTPTPPTMDGKLDEALWAKALTEVGDFVDERNGKAVPGAQTTKAGFLWDERYLYLGVQVQDNDVRTPYTERDSTLWTNGKRGRMDVVELFLSVDPEVAGSYIELQVSPAGAIFDAIFTGHRVPEWKEAAANLTLSLEKAVFVDGSLNDPKEDRGYSLEVAIPLDQLPGITEIPAKGAIFRANLFRLSNGPEIPSCWNPAGGDYHNLLAGGLLTLAE
jgi:hypothetical protein